MRLAATLVERLNLVPPVDIASIASAFASVEECDWPANCDGVALNLSEARPKIFLKKIQNRRRMRFTLAHELAHVLLPWHVETVHCNTDKGSEAEGDSPEKANVIGVSQEYQANTFASHLLVPRRFLSGIAPGYVDVPDTLDSLERANVSAAAGVMALASHLPAGYAFLVRGMSRMVRSPGTEVTFSLNGSWPELRKSLAAKSERSGAVIHQEQQVEWFEFFDSSDRVTDVIDSRRSGEILETALSSFLSDREVSLVAKSITSKVGGVLSQRSDLSDANEIRMLLAYKFQADGRYAHLLKDEEFQRYLTKRSAEISETRSGVKAPRKR
ncbi:ImmA/IrrE family metallo-endopeptidase [Streptomyces sp. NPDC056308]|uniref:ImmA/IrrE family metallo-endopeptidase n=1 Tax=Streptomyces sp. NPDC056308 TaxID=3345780 RepID=UPI0035DEA227